MYHGITFGTKHTWKDWKLVPTSRPVFAPPDPKTIYVDIPGSDGSLDLTQSLSGDVKYSDRKGNFEFYVANKKNWVSVYSEIMDYLHGQSMKIILDDDPDYYYVGRATVNKWTSNKNNSTISIDVIAEPYKMERFSSYEDWEWDPFNFETGVIREYKDLLVDGSMSLTISGGRKAVIPSFVVATEDGAGMTMWYDGTEYHLSDGVNRVVNIRITEGDFNFVFVGSGTVTVEYRGGRL